MPVTLDLKPLLRFKSAIADNMRGRAVKVGLKRWSAIYRAFAQERFVKFSRGGGDWPPLKPSTIARRRLGPKQGIRFSLKTRKQLKTPKRKRSKGKVAVLRDTNTLFAALAPSLNNPGALEKRIPFGIKVGYGGSSAHPKGGRMSIAQIAEVHQSGLGNNPQREIIVDPPRRVLNTMARAMEDALGREWAEATK